MDQTRDGETVGKRGRKRGLNSARGGGEKRGNRFPGPSFYASNISSLVSQPNHRNNNTRQDLMHTRSQRQRQPLQNIFQFSFSFASLVHPSLFFAHSLRSIALSFLSFVLSQEFPSALHASRQGERMAGTLMTPSVEAEGKKARATNLE